jgi:hypothetical protein
LMQWVSNGSGMVGQASTFHLTGVVLSLYVSCVRRLCVVINVKDIPTLKTSKIVLLYNYNLIAM